MSLVVDYTFDAAHDGVDNILSKFSSVVAELKQEKSANAQLRHEIESTGKYYVS